MGHLNVEIKAKCLDHNKVREILKSKSADFKGVDHQIDTYFKVNSGRLKLREGNIENYLIYYERENKDGPKESKVILFKNEPNSTLKNILVNANEILVVVDKKREIYFIENVKFHIDTVGDLGTFIEIEAIDKDGSIGKDRLQTQCRAYMELLSISENDLISSSYSDLILNTN
jgi:predicted adenylyl cyclase CyaB